MTLNSNELQKSWVISLKTWVPSVVNLAFYRIRIFPLGLHQSVNHFNYIWPFLKQEDLVCAGGYWKGKILLIGPFTLYYATAHSVDYVHNNFFNREI